MDIRVLDYIDDRLATSSDFDALDSLIENVKEQQDLLKKQVIKHSGFRFLLHTHQLTTSQLDDARRDHEESRTETDNHDAAIRRKGHEFQQEQASIDRRLLVATQSETSDEAAQTFEASMGRLKKLEVAAGYVELLKEVDALRWVNLKHVNMKRQELI